MMIDADAKNLAAEAASEEPLDWFLLVLGLPMSAPSYQLGPGLVLQRVERPLTVFDLAAAGAKGFREWAVLEPVTHAVTAELRTNNEAVTPQGYDALNRAWLVSAMLVARGFDRHLVPAVSAYSWNRIAGYERATRGQYGPASERLPRFQGGLLDYHLQFLHVGKQQGRLFTEGDAEWVRGKLCTFEKLATSDATFRFALEAAVDWRFARDHRTALARVWGGIEALLGVSSELVFRIALMAASVLAERGPERLAKFQSVKRLYTMRSKAVHGSEMSVESASEALEQSVSLLQDLLFDAVERGQTRSEADFNEAIFC